MEEIVINRNFASIVTSGEKTDFYGERNYFTPFKRKNMIRTSEFYNKLNSAIQIQSNILPKNTRFVKTFNNNDTIIVVEEQPMIRSIRVDFDMAPTIEKLKSIGRIEEYGYQNWVKENLKPPYIFQLAFPYIVYIALVDRNLRQRALKVYYRLHPITSLSDYLLKTNLLNVDDRQQVCLGHSDNDSNKLLTLSDLVGRLLDKFWLNVFNVDYIYNYESYQYTPEICDFLTWQYNTRKDPLFIYNVAWKPEGTLQANMDNTIRNEDDVDDLISFDRVASFFRRREKTVITPEKELLWKDISEAMNIGEVNIAIGDELIINSEKRYICSFIGMKGKVPTIIEVEDDNGKKETIKLTKELLDNFQEQILSSQYFKSIEVNGNEFEVGDILVLSFPDVSYRKVTKIRKARDGVIEVQFNNRDFYLLEKILFKKFDINNIEVFGVQIKKGETYQFVSRDEVRTPFLLSRDGKFFEIRERKGSLEAIFKSEDESEIQIPLVLDFSLESKRYYDIYNIVDGDKPIAFRVFNKIYTSSQRYTLVDGVAILGNERELQYNIKIAKSQIITENSINIKSYDININLSVGDKIVVADWDNPLEMLKVRTIESFEVDINNVLYVISNFKDQRRSDKYIDFSSGKIEMGKIRKVITEFEGIQSGDKIRANFPGIANFPKKNTNTVVAFLIDTGMKYPLMLCSNCCTIWSTPDNLAKYIIYRRGTVDWVKNLNSPIELQKIKYQFGDIVESGTHRWVLFSPIIGYDKFIPVEVMDAGFGYSFEDNRNLRKVRNKKRFGIVTPRYSIKLQNELLSSRRCIPNLHGGFVESKIFQYYLREVWEDV